MTQEENKDLQFQLINSTSNNKILQERVVSLEKELRNKNNSEQITVVSVFIPILFIFVFNFCYYVIIFLIEVCVIITKYNIKFHHFV